MDEALRKFLEHPNVTAGERARVRAELLVLRWLGRALMAVSIGGAFYVAIRWAYEGLLPDATLALLALAASAFGVGIAHFGRLLLRALRLERALRVADARTRVGQVNANGSAVAVPAMLSPPDRDPRVPVAVPYDTHIVGALALFVLVSALAGCDSGLCAQLDTLPREPSVLAIGDSILAWNNDRCHGIPERAGLVAGVHVDNRAVSGTVMHEIASQYDAARDDGPWDVVIVDGGGNDVNSFCECGACDGVLADVSERTDTLLDLMRDDGARVILVDYFGFHARAWYGFDRCEAALEDLQAQREGVDAARDDVTFVDLGALVTPDDHPEAYTFDYVHPSDEGSRILGALVAESLTPLIESFGSDRD